MPKQHLGVSLKLILQPHVFASFVIMCISTCVASLTHHRIIEPLSSRCAKFRFKAIDKSLALQRLQFICREENLTCSDEVLFSLIIT